MALRKRMTEQDEDQLREWLGKPDAGFELLFKASAQGYNSATFRQLCNNKGPTVTVAYNAVGWVFGGYASKPWTGCGAYVQAPDSFLFRLCNANKFDPLKIPANANLGYCLYDSQDRGPVFGGGHDFQTSLDNQIDILALSALAQILGFADDYLDEHYEALATENLEKLNVKE
uniref:TLDc domain-containing protein n=1 Tax=Branchiostoma floridae TaxID=7739 RepID=C3Y9T3_BRAFL|eukprot:XP_002606832.1 hypothetical protein BRAFLDRAFT_130447 [Branchiostoma floridae]